MHAPEARHMDGGSSPSKVVVGSGWWSDGTARSYHIGHSTTRTPEFFDLWYRQVERCLAPARIVVTDSRSPLKPAYAACSNVVWIELDRNYGHANDIREGRIDTKYSGFTRSVLSGAMYALCCDADCYVYVEQDCLLKGERLLEHAIGDSTCDILVGQATRYGRGLGGATSAAARWTASWVRSAASARSPARSASCHRLDEIELTDEVVEPVLRPLQLTDRQSSHPRGWRTRGTYLEPSEADVTTRRAASQS